MKILLMLGLFVGVCSCASQQSLYHWGSYEELLYEMYTNSDKATPPKQIQELTEDIYRAQSKQKKVAPGVYAHLGMLYAQIGDKPAAVAALKTEKALYPESAVMINGLISRAFPGVSLDDVKEDVPGSTYDEDEVNEVNDAVE